MPDKKQVVDKLRKAAETVDIVYLSPDPDREGEAIAWHISQILPENTVFKRVSFNSITKDEVLRSLSHPREIDDSLVNAQQARRLLDRIVGYKISPILNRRIQRGKDGFVSAGRVQSVALKLVVDREKEIAAFIPIEYWNLAAILKTEKEDRTFRANLYSVDGKRIEKELIEGKDVMIIPDKATADKILERLNNQNYIVRSVEKKEKKRNPVPPFITSTLQQEASRHYGFSSSKTMSVAQSLYEGVDLGNEGAEGLITYMRTDSVRIVDEAIQAAKKLITEQYGPEYSNPKQYATQKAAQDAHEAIRPANFNHSPEKVQPFLSREQFMLYQLIWRRLLASQMTPAVYDTVSADIAVGDDVIVRATGSMLKFNGFLAIYEERTDDEESDESKLLPPLEEGQELHMVELASDQAFTRPPPRFTEASLVKELEKSGIGRPSTYSSIMNKIQSREYTIKESGRLKPTELGCIIAAMLETSFQKIMNIGFTAEMEDNLELIAENKKDWKKLLKDFWGEFIPAVELAEKEAFVPKIMTDRDCPKCGNKLQKVWYKNKYFYGCSTYPDCDFTAPIEELDFNKADYAENFDWDQKCPKCSSEMKLRHGKYGPFLGCTTYPECKGIVNIPKKGEVIVPQEDLPSCPAIGCPGHMVQRKSWRGKAFFSCSTYPECDVIVNDVSQLEDKYQNHPRTAYVKKEKPGRGKKKVVADKEPKTKKTRAKKESKPKESKVRKPGVSVKLDEVLSNVVGTNELPYTEITKKLWDYIRANNLQDTKNKRLIVPDEKLAKLFGNKEPLDMFKLAGVVKAHVIR